MLIRILALLLLATPAFGQSQTYLLQSSLAACQARSAAQCTALGCDGTHTKWWWACEPLTAAVSGNTTGLVVHPGDPSFGVTTTNKKATSPVGLNTTEQSALKSRATLGTALPDIITEPAFIARFTPSQQSAIAGSAICGGQWNTIKAAALVDFEQSSVKNLLSCIVTQNLVPESQILTITAPTLVLSNP